jgi:hypothetical protein
VQMQQQQWQQQHNNPVDQLLFKPRERWQASTSAHLQDPCCCQVVAKIQMQTWFSRALSYCPDCVNFATVTASAPGFSLLPGPCQHTDC